jgi:hypothetical protein
MDIASHAGQLTKFLGELQSTKHITMMELSGKSQVRAELIEAEATLWRDQDADFPGESPCIFLNLTYQSSL